MILFTLLNLWLSVKAPLTVDASPLPPGPTTNLTSPSYVANPSGRGTIGIIFSSIITLTLCVYTSIHLNIAAVNKIRVPCLSFRGKPIRIKRSLVYKIHWVAIALFAPEFVLYAACDQWMNARKLRNKLRKLSAKGKNKSESENEPFIGTRATEEEEDCELEDLSNGVAQESEGKKVGDWSNVSMVSAFFVVMGGFAYQKSDIGLHRDGDYPHAILTPLGFLHLATHGYLDPSILNDNSISDRSKADWLGKLLVCAQALWMVVNCIARKAAGLPNTLIELNVVVHVVFTVIVYAIWWKKPLNINEPIVLSLVGKENDVTAPVNLDRLIPEHIVAGVRISLQATKSGFVYEARHSRHIPVDNSDSDSDGEDAETRMSSWSPEPVESPMIWGLFTFLGVIYAVCHLTAWNGHFPSFYERLFWRISCIVIATGGPACVILLLLVGCFRPELSTPSSFSHASGPSTPMLDVFQNIYDYITTFFFLIPLVVLYVLSRAFIVVEAFISMRCLPAGAYETVDWSQFVPHL
ncbi:hypothetical protein BZA77DRAFT_263763 [Pyronema omphalodes]|nr:hypothetical protein BZA77DRAFT_263763 [Pyronema omphalodes]